MSFLAEWIKARKEVRLATIEFMKLKYENQRNDELKRKHYEQKAKKFTLVHECIQHWTHTSSNKYGSEKKKYKLFIHLYENEFGDRKWEMTTDLSNEFRAKNGLDDNDHQDTDFFITTVKPWMNGSYVAGIKTYDECRQAEMVARLKNG